jgi:pimeloyl-ACP methyl ester carboxylesterase
MAKLFDALREKYRVCAYDRRVVGQSSAAPIPRKAANITADAFDTLAAAHEGGPYILFATCMGGLLVRNYAATQKVAGFVTSNQPGTSGEFAKWVAPLMSSADRAADEA